MTQELKLMELKYGVLPYNLGFTIGHSTEKEGPTFKNIGI